MTKYFHSDLIQVVAEAICCRGDGCRHKRSPRRNLVCTKDDWAAEAGHCLTALLPTFEGVVMETALLNLTDPAKPPAAIVADFLSRPQRPLTDLKREDESQ